VLDHQEKCTDRQLRNRHTQPPSYIHRRMPRPTRTLAGAVRKHDANCREDLEVGEDGLGLWVKQLGRAVCVGFGGRLVGDCGMFFRFRCLGTRHRPASSCGIM
jgi:hypothetical protein